METFGQILQGVVAGIGILAAGTSLVYLASVNGLGLRLVMNGQVIEIVAPAVAQANETTGVPQANTPTENGGETVAVLPETPVSTPEAPEQTRSPYFDRVAADLSLLVVSLERLDDLLATPKPDDSSWRSEVELVIHATEMGYDRLSYVDAPEEAASIHSRLLDTAGRCTNILDLLAGDLGRTTEETFSIVRGSLAMCTDELSTILKQVQSQ